jgi:hypothetical protein
MIPYRSILSATDLNYNNVIKTIDSDIKRAIQLKEIPIHRIKLSSDSVYPYCMIGIYSFIYESIKALIDGTIEEVIDYKVKLFIIIICCIYSNYTNIDKPLSKLCWLCGRSIHGMKLGFFPTYMDNVSIILHTSCFTRCNNIRKSCYKNNITINDISYNYIVMNNFPDSKEKIIRLNQYRGFEENMIDSYLDIVVYKDNMMYMLSYYRDDYIPFEKSIQESFDLPVYFGDNYLKVIKDYFINKKYCIYKCIILLCISTHINECNDIMDYIKSIFIRVILIYNEKYHVDNNNIYNRCIYSKEDQKTTFDKLF